MKPRSRRLEPVARIAENRERDAARRFGESWRVVVEQQSRLDELVRYRDEYCNDISGVTGTAMGAARLQEYRSFIGRLNAAIEQQANLIRTLQAQSDARRDHWMARRGHMRAVDKVLDRCRSDERRQAEKREQQVTDERGGRARRGNSPD